MQFDPIGYVALERLTPGPADPTGLSPDGWAAPVAVLTFGWWPPTPDNSTDSPGRRLVERDLDLIVPADIVCGDRDRWTVDGAAFVQIGSAQDYNHGPFGTDVPLVVYLKRAEG